MIEITPTLWLDEKELQLDFVRASGPGGQNVNKVATAVQLRFDVRRSPSLPEDVKVRLVNLAGNRITQDGILVIDARRYRTQEHNREDAVRRFITLVRKALKTPQARTATKPTRASRVKRLKLKIQRGKIKQSRRKIDDDWE
jgi:ribosome-associated protein